MDSVETASQELERAHTAYASTVHEVLTDEVLDAISKVDPEGAALIHQARTEWERAGQKLHDAMVGRSS